MAKFSMESMARPVDPDKIKKGQIETYLDKFSGAAEERVIMIPLDRLVDFPDHPFRVEEDEDMMKLVASIREYGVLEPILAKPLEGGDYRIIAGHRRKLASRLAGLIEIPAIPRNVSDDQAVIDMVDSNLRREKIPPTDRAKAYRMKLEAIKCQRKHANQILSQIETKQESGADGTLSQFETKLRSDEELAQEMGESRAQIQRYIRIDKHLDKSLHPLVDSGKIGFSVAVELSYIRPEIQRAFINALGGKKPNMKQVTALRENLKDPELPQAEAIEKAIWQQLEIKFEPPRDDRPESPSRTVDPADEPRPGTKEKTLPEGLGIRFEPPADPPEDPPAGEEPAPHWLAGAAYEATAGFILKAAELCNRSAPDGREISPEMVQFLLCGLQWASAEITVEEATIYYQKERKRP